MCVIDGFDVYGECDDEWGDDECGVGRVERNGLCVRVLGVGGRAATIITFGGNCGDDLCCEFVV